MHIARSYHYDLFGDVDRAAELQRLQKQATVLLDAELAQLQAFGLRAGQRVLELGCGPGFITGPLSDLSGEAVGIDTSAELLAAARAVVAPVHPNVDFQEGSAYGTGLPNASVDFVYSRLVFQHLSHPGDALAEVRRVLRPGGRVCVMDIDDGFLAVDPAPAAFSRLTARALEAQKARGGDRHVGRKLPRLLQQAGFTRVRLHTVAVTSAELGLGAFLDITTRFKAIQVGDAEAIGLAKELGALAALPAAEQPFGVVVVFFATGDAPGSA